MSNRRKRLAFLNHKINNGYDAIKRRLRHPLGGPGLLQIVPYRGYGNATELHLTGRVLEDRGIAPPAEGDTRWDNLVNMMKRMNSREVPHARLLARFQGIEREIVANEEGMFELAIEPVPPLEADGLWRSTELELLEPHSPRQESPVRAEGKVLVPPASARFGVISDIDDTVILTNATNRLHMLLTVLLASARTRLPFPGVAAFYRALHTGVSGADRNPLFYVSNGLWNLYDLLIEFFELQGIPRGPLLLRSWGISRKELRSSEQRKHKQSLIRLILEFYPDLPFILIGDSGEADPEIYCQMVHEHPDRILGVYIRSVHPNPGRVAAVHALVKEVVATGSNLILAQDSLAMARHAVQEGWISDEGFAAVQADLDQA